MTITADGASELQMPNLLLQQSKDVLITARFPDMSDGTGMTSTFYIKYDRITPDTDPSVQSYSSSIINDPDNAGATMSQYIIPAADTGMTGVYWWRVDRTDATGKIKTWNYGPLIIQAV